MADDLVFSFDSPPSGDEAEWPRVLGGKGAGLARMRRLGLPVPPGFTLPTTVCHRFLAEGWWAGLDDAVVAGLDQLESALGRELGSTHAPLLVSVRSGAPVSMPGMMDTVLNAGMTPEVAGALARLTGDEQFGWDTYRRFIESYATIVGQAPSEVMAETAASVSGGRALHDVPADELPAVLADWRLTLAERNFDIPTSPREQIVTAIQAVFRSWDSDRAAVYRDRENIPADLGTAATVQAMVFGNLGTSSGTGVAFTRDPSTGEPGIVGDFLVGAQGEDVVAGTHQTRPIADMRNHWPQLAVQLDEVAATLEHELADVVDIEFTVEDGVLWILQARVGKRSPRAALRLAVAMAEDPGFPVDREEAVRRVAHLLDAPPREVNVAEDADADVVADGLAASPGRAVGVLCLDLDDAVARAEAGDDVVLIRAETSPADIRGMAAAKALVTTLGGLVSHAAVVARSWGIPAVVGAGDIRIESDAIEAKGCRVPVGAEVTVDGDRGVLLLGAHAGEADEMPEVAVLRAWRDDLGVGGPGEDAPDSGSADRSSNQARLAEALSAEDCLRALMLKGMASVDGLAEMVRAQPAAVATALDALVEADQVQDAPGDRFLLTADGTAAVEACYRSEAAEATPAIEPHLDRFHQLNQRFKEVVTSWQMREVDGESVMNDHTDAAYDSGVIDALADEVHVGICEVLGAIASSVPRLEEYRDRLGAAIDAVRSGDTEMVAHPLRSSYHTVWFELHEELIRLCGRNRADEAAAGRA